LSFSVKQKHQYIEPIQFMHPRTPQTSAHSGQLSRVIRFMHPRFRRRQRVRTSYL